MHEQALRSLLSLVVSIALAASPAEAQIFQSTPGQIPQGSPGNNSTTEELDFGDCDGDGDWDVAMADGGDEGNDQSRLWTNDGAGVFVDVTATHLPVVSNQSTDIDFADYDGDGDPDLHLSNVSTIQNQPCRFWTNTGGGFYADQTTTRWIGLGGGGSSISPAAVLPPATGGWIDWCTDTDFADLDDDGDLDLVHASYGSAFSGNVPTRLFLNDGSGHYSEFNPSGVQLAGIPIATGTPCMWCEGTQFPNTTNFTGANCDIATNGLGVELVDTDGDYDLDIVHGARGDPPRLFRNRYVENGSVLRFFRDSTGKDYPPGYATGTGHYEQELSDMDCDGDVDLVGINWIGLFDQVYAGGPGGIFGSPAALASSGNDGNDADLGDFDNDGELDIFISAFVNTDRVYKSQNLCTLDFVLLSDAESGISGTQRTLDAEVADIDGDADYDVMTAEDSGKANILFKNVLVGSGDVTAPYIPAVEALGPHTASSSAVRAHAQVYDNVPFWLLAHNSTSVALSVDGCGLPAESAKSSGGQIFRALLPGNLVGSVGYRFQSADPHGNVGSSVTLGYTGSTGLVYATGVGAGSPGVLGIPSVHALSVPFAGTLLYLAGKNAPASTTFFLAITTAPMPGAPLHLPGLCNVNVSGAILLLKSGLTDAAGCAVAPVPVPSMAPAGATVHAQFFALDGTGGDLFSSSAGLAITTQ